MQFSEIVNLDKFPITDLDFQKSCKSMLDKNGALNLEKFLQPAAIKEIREEGIKNQHLAHYVKNDHNVYLMANDPKIARATCSEMCYSLLPHLYYV